MAANQTPNYGLCQWEASDPVLRADFNADNQKIDAALAQKADASALAGKADQSALASLATKAEVSTVQSTVPLLAFGRYTGNGAASQAVSLPFAPKMVLVWPQQEYIVAFYTDISQCWGGMALQNAPLTCGGGTVLSIQGAGFQVYLTASASRERAYTNQQGVSYLYFAVG